MIKATKPGGGGWGQKTPLLDSFEAWNSMCLNVRPNFCNPSSEIMTPYMLNIFECYEK